MFKFSWKRFVNFFKKATHVELKDVRKELPWHETRKWAKRSLSRIDKIIVHQALCTTSAKSINKYHITPAENNHLSKDGAPHIAYHYAIDFNGDALFCNSHTDVTWHCKGKNTSSLGIVVCGDFDYPGQTKVSEAPSKKQMKNLKKLLNYLKKEFNLKDQDVYGHCDFGKPSCPGIAIYKLINERKAV
jgi:hypothetical protein